MSVALAIGWAVAMSAAVFATIFCSGWKRATAGAAVAVLLAVFVVRLIDKEQDCQDRGGVLTSYGHCVQPVGD